MVLNGVGGRTIEEAQRNISTQEFFQWAKYRAKRGSLNTGFSLEQSIARLSTMYANVNYKGSYEMRQFAPHMDEPELTIDMLKEWAKDGV